MNFSPLDVAVQFTLSGYRCLFPTHVISYQSDARRRKDRCGEQGCCLRLEPRKSLGSDVLRSQGDFEFFISSNSVQSAWARLLDAWRNIPPSPWTDLTGRICTPEHISSLTAIKVHICILWTPHQNLLCTFQAAWMAKLVCHDYDHCSVDVYV